MKKWFAALVFSLIAPLAMAANTIDIIQPYARDVPPGQPQPAGFNALKE